MTTRRSIERASREAAGWLLVAALVYSPWDYGGTTAEAIRNLNWNLAALLAVWLIGRVAWCVGKRTGLGGTGIGDLPGLPRGIPRAIQGYVAKAPFSHNKSFFSWVLLGVSALLLLVGWGMALNAHSICDFDYFVFCRIRSPLPSLPGSVDYSLSCAWMTRATLLLTCLWVTADVMQDEKWLVRIWWVIGLIGASIALLGLLQKATGAEMILWQMPDQEGKKTFFSTYYYHANAGAYLNLTFPLIAGLAYRYFTRPGHHATKALWLTLLLIHMVAILSNTSRMSELIGVVLAFVLITAAAGMMVRRARDIHWPTVIVELFVLAVALWAVTQASRLDEPIKRWSETQLGSASFGRWDANMAAWHSIAPAGPLGFGPGTFSVVFPSFAGALGDPTQTVWLFLHDDYLQTVMEWGWFGSLLWGGVFFGGMIVAIRGLLSKRLAWRPRQRLLLPLVLMALIGVAIHAAVDFPLQISSIQLYVAVYLGLCWGSGRWGIDDRRTEDRRRRMKI